MGMAVHRWLVPLFDDLGFGRLSALRIPGVDVPDEPSRTIEITHRWQRALIHVVPWDSELDRNRPGTASPHALVQEALNRTPGHLWGVVTNGRRVRLLRDSHSHSSASYVEFDLEAILDGHLFNEFVLLYRVLHASSFEIAAQDPPSACRLEQWRVEAVHSSVQALDSLRDNVERAITALGTGFLRHPDNTGLRGGVDADVLHAALLRLVYRILFLFTIEDRGLLHHPSTDERARQRYADYFSTTRLRRLAGLRRGGQHGDLYKALLIVLNALGAEEGRPELGLAGLGGLFSQADEDLPLAATELSNEALLSAVRHLSRIRDTGTGRWRAVDYRSMGARELGSVYEALLETVPEYDREVRSFRLVPRAGNERKRTGSYYTPSSLVERILDTSLEPVLDEAVKRAETDAGASHQADPSETVADELLSVTVCDPACGSGHFLVAAAHRIAKRVAAVRERNPEPTEDAVRVAMHEVVARCVYGVDLNPMAVALAKVSLWMEGMAPGRPLDLLDPHVKHGNALVGATPAKLRVALPDSAFTAVEGDDRAVASALARRNALERSGQEGLTCSEDAAVKVANTEYAMGLLELGAIRAGELRDVRKQEKVYAAWRSSERYGHTMHVADAWCSAFMWEKTTTAPPAITQAVLRELSDPEGSTASREVHAEIIRLRGRYGFFHWQLEFPDVFPVPEDGHGVDGDTGWDGGFDCVVTNPPWDKLDFEDKKYFSVVEPSIARVSGVARRRRITEWERANPETGQEYRQARRWVKASLHFAARSGLYPRCAAGLRVKGVNSLQIDQLFAERCMSLVRRKGRVGLIVPSSIATSAGAQKLFEGLTDDMSVVSLYDFENLNRIFGGVHSSYKFCLLSLVRQLPEPGATFAFYLHDPAELDNASRTFRMTSEEIRLLSPNTRTLPVFRTRRDADLTLSLYHRVRVLWEEGVRGGNRWNLRAKNLFNITDDSGLFHRREELEDGGWVLAGNVFVRDGQRMLPLYEGKMAHHFDHRGNSFTGVGSGDIRQFDVGERKDPRTVPMPRYWVAERAEGGGVEDRLESVGWDRGWLYGWRDVCRATDERTAIPAFVPRMATADTFSLMLPVQEPPLIAALCAVQSSLVFDYVSRQKISGAHMTLMAWKQLPVPAPEDLEPHAGFLVPRVLELVYTAHDMAPLARDLGYPGPPFTWDEERRALLRAELDAYCFHLYGLERDDVIHVLETFRTARGGLKNNEIARFGSYRTRDLVLDAFDRPLLG
jgi:hypothetical protein